MKLLIMLGVLFSAQVSAEHFTVEYQKDHPGGVALREAYEYLVKLINPMTPHLAEDLWFGIGETQKVMFIFIAAVPFTTEPNSPDGFLPYLRDPKTLARPWAVPATIGANVRTKGRKRAITMVLPPCLS